MTIVPELRDTVHRRHHQSLTDQEERQADIVVVTIVPELHGALYGDDDIRTVGQYTSATTWTFESLQAGYLQEALSIKTPRKAAQVLISAAYYGSPGAIVKGRGRFDVTELLRGLVDQVCESHSMYISMGLASRLRKRVVRRLIHLLVPFLRIDIAEWRHALACESHHVTGAAAG